MAAGWELYGEGYNANVYGKDSSNYVLKVFESDTPYRKFLELITKHQNPHFPVIKGNFKINSRYYAVRMEKLASIGYGSDLGGMLSAYLNSKKKLGYQIEYLNKFKEFSKDKPELVKALDLIDEFLLDSYKLDLHNDNIMRRKDGTIVIIDPVRN